MSLIISQQSAAFLGSLLLGAALGAVYDVFRIFRKAFCQPSWMIWFEDVVYLIICAVITFGYMLQSNEGQVRVFIVIGEFIGAVLYYLTLGKLVMAVSLFIISIITKILRLIYIVVIKPILTVFKFLGKILTKVYNFFAKIFKKSAIKFKNSLKAGSKLLYNYLESIRLKLRLKKKGKSYGKE